MINPTKAFFGQTKVLCFSQYIYLYYFNKIYRKNIIINKIEIYNFNSVKKIKINLIRIRTWD